MSNAKEVAIKVIDVNKTFKLPHEKQSSLKGLFLNTFRRKTYEKQSALKNISFEVCKGEFFGIVGRNGGGKSTLLKLLAGIYSPDSGHIQVNGKLTPFIELGVGFNPELTGRENVFLNGALLGFNRKEMLDMYDEIIAFAELEKFMDQKLKNYSSGMQVRLAFSIAIRAESDILVMDEVLAVGDAAFQKKCFDIFRNLKAKGRTIILVTHDMGNIERFCDRVLVISKGKQIAITTPSEAAALYAKLNIENDSPNFADSSSNRWGYGGVRIKKISMRSNGKPTDVFKTGADLEINVHIKREDAHKNTPLICGLAIFNQEGVNVSGPNSIGIKKNINNSEFTYSIPKLPLLTGEYKVTVALFDNTMTTPMDVLDKSTTFSVITGSRKYGIVDLNGRWSTE